MICCVCIYDLVEELERGRESEERVSFFPFRFLVNSSLFLSPLSLKTSKTKTQNLLTVLPPDTYSTTGSLAPVTSLPISMWPTQ